MCEIKSYTFTFDGYEDDSVFSINSTDILSAERELLEKFPKATNIDCIEYEDI